MRSQFQYIVKTSKSGKQGRKYIEVGPGEGETSTTVPELCKNELKTEIGQKPKAKKTPKAKKVITPGSQTVDESKKTPVKFSSTAEDVTTRQNGRMTSRITINLNTMDLYIFVISVIIAHRR